MTSPEQLLGPAPTTRDGWAEALVALIAPATRLATSGPERLPMHATVNDRGAAWFELVARPLWGLAAHAAGGFSADRQWEEVRRALTAALNPENPWYIGTPQGIDQRLVEAAAVGYALAAAPEQLWQPLGGRQRDHLTDWLLAASAAEPADNNWHFFPVLAAAGLRAVGVPVEEARTEAHLDRIDQFALDAGWYADGAGTPERPGARDYYNPFGFHFYGLLLARLKAVGDDRARAYRERATVFAPQFQHWFAADGAAVPFGRSLTYRFAQASFWSMLAAADLPALDWATVRGLAERHLGWWWRQPILAPDGLLTPGYAYPNSSVVEQYIGAGSPYWGTKIFAALAAPPTHPFWTVDPPPSAKSLSVQPEAAMVLNRDATGDVVALAGQSAPGWNPRSAAAKYAKFAYSTAAGFGVPTGEPTLEEGGIDGTLALSDDGIRWLTRRDGIATVDGQTLIVHWQPWPDVTIETRLWHADDGHTREHRITTGRRLHLAEGGFCVPKTGVGLAVFDTVTSARSAAATGDGLHSEITCRSRHPATGS